MKKQTCMYKQFLFQINQENKKTKNIIVDGQMLTNGNRTGDDK